MSEQRQYEPVRQPFTEQELSNMKEELIAAVGDVKALRTEKASAMSTMGAAIRAAETRVFELQGKLSLGYESLDVEVMFLFDDPEPGRKKVVRADTMELLRIEPMTPRERQQNFGFGVPEEEK